MKIFIRNVLSLRKIGRFFGTFFWAVLISSCIPESYFLGDSYTSFHWHKVNEPFTPRTPLEIIAVEAAKTGKTIKSNNITAYCLAYTPQTQLTVTVSVNNETSDPMSIKLISYVKVDGGKVDSFSDAVEGPSLDEDFEKTIFNAALSAKSGMNAVTIYSRPDQNFTVFGTYLPDCVAKVTVIPGFQRDGEPFTIRMVPVCGL